jgi:hypothetical protein
MNIEDIKKDARADQAEMDAQCDRFIAKTMTDQFMLATFDIIAGKDEVKRKLLEAMITACMKSAHQDGVSSAVRRMLMKITRTDKAAEDAIKAIDEFLERSIREGGPKLNPTIQKL